MVTAGRHADDCATTDQRQRGHPPVGRSGQSHRRKQGSRLFFTDFGKVEIRPRGGVLPPPHHAFHVLQHDVAALPVVVVDEEVVDGQSGAVLEDDQEVIAGLLEAFDRFRTGLDLDDARPIKHQIRRFNIGNLAGRFGDDFHIHAVPRENLK